MRLPDLPRIALALALTLPAAAQTPATLTGNWLVTGEDQSDPFYLRMTLDQQGDKLSGTLTSDKFQGGTVTGNAIHFIVSNNRGGSEEIHATVANGVITGTAIGTGHGEPTPHAVSFTAKPVPPLHNGKPAHYDFTPTVFYREFSPANKPVLTIHPLDTVHTTTVDAGGTDEHGVDRTRGGNPETGPFYIEGALPGDTLVIHINHLRLNRNWAISDDYLVDRALTRDLTLSSKDNGKSVRWNLDLAKGLASPQDPGPHMKSFTIPVHPMLGCVATAVGRDTAPPRTQDSGSYGGNMDFNGLNEGDTLYLPVSNPGALLYLGDAHALQGDGELNGNALETSMDVEFTVDVLPGKRINTPRVETGADIISLGLDGSIDSAFADATGDMAQWLADDYKLTPSEVAEFLGVASEYHVSEVADRNAGVVLKIAKSKLSTLPAPQPSSGDDPTVPHISK